MIGSGPLLDHGRDDVGLAAGEQALDGLAHAGNAVDDDPADAEQHGQAAGHDLTGTQASPCGPLEAG